MSVRMTGKEMKAYYVDSVAWPEGAYHDDCVIVVDGKRQEGVDAEELADGAVIEVECGIVFFPDGSDMDLVEHAKEWKARQEGVYGRFYAPREHLASVIEAIKAAGGQFVED